MDTSMFSAESPRRIAFFIKTVIFVVYILKRKGKREPARLLEDDGEDKKDHEMITGCQIGLTA